MENHRSSLLSARSVRSSSGFTLIELLVVIAIIGLLAGIIMASLSTSRKKGTDARRSADLYQIRNAAILYSGDNQGQVPSTLAPLVTGGFISVLPVDPTGGASYNYAAIQNGGACLAFHLGASLQVPASPLLTADIDAPATGTVCAGSAANFDGADTGKCNASDAGTYCYDITN